MFVKVRSTTNIIKLININQIELVLEHKISEDEKILTIETNSAKTEIAGTLESFAKTLADIIKTKQIMWYKPQ